MRALRPDEAAGCSPPALSYRQVIAELRKVVRPTRHELITYTSVVLVFVLVVMIASSPVSTSALVLWACWSLQLRLTDPGASGARPKHRGRGRTEAKPGTEYVDQGSRTPSCPERHRVTDACRPAATAPTCRTFRPRRRGPVGPTPTPSGRRRRPDETDGKPGSAPTRSRPTDAGGRGGARREEFKAGRLRRPPGTGSSSTPTPATRTG